MNHLCPARDLEWHKDNNVNREACRNFSIFFIKRFEETDFLCNSNPHHLATSFIGILESFWKFWRYRTKQKRNFCSLKLRQQWRLNWADSWKAPPKVIINGSNRKDLTWAKMILRTTIVPVFRPQREKWINFLISSKILSNVIEIFHLCLGPTVQNLISIQSNLICYPFWITNKILNLPLSKNWTSSSRSLSVIFSYWTWWIFSAEINVLIPWNHTKLREQIILYPMNGWVVLTNYERQKIPHIRPFTIYCSCIIR